MSLIDQSNESAPPPNSPLKSILPYTTVLMIIAVLYVGWIMYSRRQEAADAEQAAVTRKAEAEKRKTDLIFGSGEVKFTTLEAGTANLQRGDTTQLCYGVLNATSVKIDPPIEQIKPSSRHCMDITPKKTTAYTVTAYDAKGQSKSLTLTITVK